jgi:hypothetical protein
MWCNSVALCVGLHLFCFFYAVGVLSGLEPAAALVAMRVPLAFFIISVELLVSIRFSVALSFPFSLKNAATSTYGKRKGKNL